MKSHDEEFLLKRANSFFERGRLPKALVCYKLLRRVASTPSVREELCLQIARTHALLGNFDDAIMFYNELRILVEWTKLPDIDVQIARVYREMGDFQTAIQWYRRVLEESPEYPGDVLYWIAELLNIDRDKMQIEESLACLDKAMREDRQLVLDWEIHNTRGFTFMLQGNPLQALREFKSALSKNTFDSIDIPGNVYNNMGTCLALLQRNDEAIVQFRKAIKHQRSLHDTKGYAHYFIGVLFFIASQQTEARKEFQKARGMFELSKKRGEIPSWYADSYLGRISKWLRDFNEHALRQEGCQRIKVAIMEGVIVAEISSIESMHGALKVFISYAFADKRIVRKLVKRLQKDGFDPWFDEIKLLPGQHFDSEIKRAIAESGAILVCLSKNSVPKKGYFQKEITIALDEADKEPEGTIFIIPVRIEECDVPDRLKELQWVDYFSKDGYDSLKSALQDRAKKIDRQQKPA